MRTSESGHLCRQLWQLDYFTEGSVPDALIGVPTSWTPEQIKQFQDYWDTEFAGDLAKRRRAKFVPGDSASRVHQTKEPDHKDDFDEWLARIICFAFSVPPQWAVKLMNRATADNQSAQSEEEGLEPTKEWVKDLVDEIIAEEFSSPDLELHWLDEDADAAGLEASLEGRVKLGAVTLNEMRDHLGLDPYANAAADRPMVLTPTGYVPIEANAGGEGSDAGGKATPIAKAAADDPKHPGWPAGTPGGIGGRFRPKDGGDPSGDTGNNAEANRPVQYAALDTGTRTDVGGEPSGRDNSGGETIEAASNNWRSLPVNLAAEEAPNGPGHTIDQHVNKSDEELQEQMAAKTSRRLFFSVVDRREGSFDLIENANDFVNRTLQNNGPLVDRVADGDENDDYITWRFGYPTGRELYRPDPDSDPYMRTTYSVGVWIVHDPGSPRGFRVITAFPRND